MDFSFFYLAMHSLGEDVERSYTPVSTLEGPRPVHPQAQQEGETIELMIKLYKDGKMSSFLDNLEQGAANNRIHSSIIPPIIMGQIYGIVHSFIHLHVHFR